MRAYLTLVLAMALPGCDFFDGDGDDTEVVDEVKEPEQHRVLWSLAVGDLDGDGLPDLAGAAFSVAVAVPQSGPASFGAPVQSDEDADAFWTRAGDTDGDGIAEMFTLGQTVRAWRPGVERLEPITAPLALLLADGSMGDIDGDGRVELLGGSGHTVVAVRVAGGALVAEDVVTDELLNDAAEPITLDVDGDGVMELAVLHRTSAEVRAAHVYRREPDGWTLHTALTLDADTLHAADLDGDGRDELVLLKREVVRWACTTADGFVPCGAQVVPHDAAWYWTSLAAGDVTGDGRDELVLSSPRPELVVLTAPDADLTFEELARYDDAGMSSRVADMDGDGDLDLATSGPAVTILLNDGGTLGARRTMQIPVE